MRKLFYISILLVPIFSKATVRYVTVTGAGQQDGTSWTNAAPGTALQSMIDASGLGDQVWVAAGTYKPTATTDRGMAFSMKNGVAIYGSFTGNETSLAQRIFTCGPGSILSGSIGAAGIDDNSYHVISNGNGLTNTAILDGFEIRDANDPRTPTNSQGLGGGIFNNGGAGASCNPTIRNCVITNNRAGFGAGIFDSGYDGGNANPVIENCIIANNHAYMGGGGLDNYGLSGNASPTIINCIFYGNTAAERAGAMYCWGGGGGNANPVVRNTVFAKNSAIDGGAIVSDRLNAAGGGSSGNSNPTFANCIFWDNSVTGIGSNFFILGSANLNATYTIIDLTGQTAPHVLSGLTTGNLSSNPLFENINNAIGGDGCWLTADDGLQLEDVSPAINAGTNANAASTDITGSPRIVGTTVDLGAYESEVEVVTSLENEPLISVYPNPAQDKLHVSTVDGKIPDKVYISDAMGRLCAGNLTTGGWIDVSFFRSGLYHVSIVRDGITTRLRWIKN